MIDVMVPHVRHTSHKQCFNHNARDVEKQTCRGQLAHLMLANMRDRHMCTSHVRRDGSQIHRGTYQALDITRNGRLLSITQVP